ncbi:hypothetical protein PLESTM_000919800 [Pleodorina starrii]|nr:hypothetical protein PLESTM_000919800 [Pleodorina starrii]
MTLEKGKAYGQEQIQQTLQDKARTRLNNPAPHQAPQRERVSRSTIPSSARQGGGGGGGGGGAGGGGGGGGGAPRTRRWKSLIRPDVNLGVPQLMMILEPNIVWEHTKAYVGAVGREVEANVTPGEFFEGWHKGGRRAHGVYEGSYWELMGDCDELAEMLRKLSKAPALLDEPPLELPPPPELPAWDDFKPNLHLIPAAPSLPPLKLPPFRAPILEPELPFMEPEYLPLPTVPPAPKEEPLPIFIPPEFLQVEPLVEPEYVDPPPPITPEPPHPPAFGQPKHGHDWSGNRPFQLDLPSRESFLADAASKRIMDTSRFVHPPNNLPRVPELEQLDIDMLRGLDLEPIPRLELAWMGGPEPDPPYASVPSSPAALSRSTSRGPSRPLSAVPSRPMSAAAPAVRPLSAAPPPPRPMSAAVIPASGGGGRGGSGGGGPGGPSSPFASAAAAEEAEVLEAPPTASVGRPRAASASIRKTQLDSDGGAVRPWSAGPSRAAPAAADAAAAAPAAPAAAGPKTPRIRSARGGSGGLGIRTFQPPPPPPQASVRTPEELAWEEARSVASEASGTPRMWVNFSAPFADLPPIMLPPRPEPDPEPLPEDFPHDTLEELPVYLPPALLDPPVYEEPPQFVPVWAPPCEPRPVGFLRGTAPVLLCDVSGTMNPRQQGRFRDMKRCAVDLLDPEGEIATAAVGFDVITFSGGAWSWSAGYGERMGLLQSSQVPYSGRQVGGRYSSKTPPGAGGPGSRNVSPDRIGGRFGAPSSAAVSSFGGKGGGISLMPAQPDLLSDAQRWVANWPDAVGQTNLLAAFALAEQLHGPGADCWYVLSDGMAHDQQGCLEFLARRNDAGCMPVIHAVGFLPAEASPDTAGERFLRGIAELTGGSYQRYSPDIAKVWVAGQGFVRHELRGESPEQREERQWSERQLRAERIKNLRLGIVEPLEATMERVAVMHNQLRVAPSVRSNEAAVAEARRRHNLASESVRLTNERRLADATSSYEAALQAARARNQAKVDAAREAFLQSHGEWEREYLERVQEWEDAKATLERQREEQLAAARAAVPSPYGTPSSSGAAKPSTASASPLSPSQSQPQPYLMSSPGSSGSRPTSATRAAAFPRNRAGSLLLSPSIEPSEHRAAYAAAEYDTVHGLDRLSEKLSYSSSATPPGSRPLSAIAAAASSGGSRPVSGGGVKSDGGDGGGGGAAAAAGGASEYLEAITEDMTEASAPLDAVYTGGATAAAAAAADGALDDDGLDVRPSRGRGGGGGGRDQDSAGRGSGGGSRISSAASAPPPSSRPLSGRASGSIGGAAAAAGGGGSVRLGSARSASSAGGGRKSSVLGSLPGAASLPLPPPPLPEPSSPLAPLRGERSDDFKRRLFPAEVVEELDATNAARLGEIRQRWEDIVNADVAANAGRRLSTMRRNAARLEEYRAAVYDTYANGLIRDVVYGGAVRVAANLALMDNAEAAYLAEVERINAENDRLRALHTAEVEERRAKEGVHAQAVRRWQEGQEAAQRQHEADREKARAEHEANITRLKAEWRAKTQQVLELNDARLTEAEAMHEALTDQIKETNRQHKEEHTEALRQRREVEATNLSRLAEAKAVHKVRLESRAADNERLIRNSMEEHQALCVRLAEEYEENKAQSEVDHSELVAFLRAANEQLTEEARRRYQEALAEVQAAYEAECAEVREAHARELERVKRFNVEIWPKVHVARLAQAELARVQLFAEHIRFCANKFEMGVNFVPNTPNYDRVVEMQALTEALSKAFPDVAPNSLPWPDHERRLEPGTGWVAAPAARNLTYRDPMDIINKIAKGKPINLSSNQGNSNGPSRGDSPAPPTSRGHSATPAGAVGAADGGDAAAGSLTSGGSTDEALSPQHTQHPIPYGSSSSYTPRHLTRPLSAGRARFANVLGGIGGGGESSYGYGSQRPMSAAVPAPSSARVEAWGNAAAAAASALSSPGGPLRPNSAAGGSGGGGGGYQNPSAWRRSNTSVLRAGSPRLPSTYAASNFGGGGGGGPSSTAGGVAASSTLASAVAAAAAATAAMGALGSRPGTARPGTAHGSVGGGGLGSSRPRSAGPGPRPPARVAVDVTSLQASVARSKAQAGAHMLTSAALAGFSKDVPKLRYPEVDVPQALTIASSLRSS